MKRIALAILVLAVLFLMAGCVSRNEALQDTGLLGEHQVIAKEQAHELNGDFSGWTLFFISSVSGEVNSGQVYTFWWEPKPGEMIATSILREKTKIIRDESKDIPTIEFSFQYCWLNNVTHIDPIYSKHDQQDLNSIIHEKDAETFVLIRISSNTLKKEKYLPQV